MNYKSLYNLFSVSSLLLLLSCQPQPPAPSDAESGAPATTEAAPSGTGKYYRLEGTIGELPVVMHLTRLPDVYNGGASDNYSAYYFYEKYQNPISVFGWTDSLGQLVLQEPDYNSDTSAEFEGAFADGVYQGQWTSGDGKTRLPFVLKENYDGGAVAFDIPVYRDSVKLLPGRSDSPGGFFTFFALADKSGDAYLQQVMREVQLGDSLSKAHPTLAAGIQARKAGFFDMYRNDMKDMGVDTIQNLEESKFMFTYEESTSPEIIWNEGDGLLSLGITEYWYTGGAHGNYGTALYSYDLKAQKVLTAADVFVPGYEAALGKALEKAARARFNAGSKAPLSEVLLVDAIEPNDNFCLTGKGVLFSYAPYEIGPYAMGQIDLFIPFAEIKSLLQPGR